MFFLKKAAIGYVCWKCGEDTEEYHSDSSDEVCEVCDYPFVKIKLRGLRRLENIKNYFLSKGMVVEWYEPNIRYLIDPGIHYDLR